MPDSTTADAPGEPIPTGSAHSPASPMQKIIAISVCVVVFRTYVAVFENSGIIRWQVFAPRWANWLLPMLSIVLGAVAAKLANRWFDRFISVLFGFMFGAAVTLPISSIHGAVLGGLAGGIVIIPAMRRLTVMIIGILFKLGLPVLLVSVCAGFAASTRRGIWPEQSVYVLMSFVIVGLVLFTFLWTWWLSRGSRKTASDLADQRDKAARTAHYVLGTTCAFVFLAIGWVVGLEIDNYRVHAQMTSGSWLYAEVGPIREWPFKGIRSVVNQTWIWEGATDEDFKYLSRFDQLSAVHCRLGKQVTAQGTSRLGGLPIDMLHLEDSDDARNGFLQQLSRMAHLSLNRSKEIGDTTLSYLACERSLQGLELQGTRITNEGLEHLKGYTSLRSLDVSETRIGDQGVAHLVGVPLSTLKLGGTQVTGECVNTLKSMAMLMELDLSNTKVEVADLAPLAGLAKLAGSPQAGLITLNLRGQKVDDDDVTTLRTFKQLRSLTIRDSRIEDAAALRVAGLSHIEIDVWKLSPATAKQLKPTLHDECYFWVDNRHVSKSDMERLVCLNQEISFEGCTFDVDAIDYLVDATHEQFSFQRCDFNDEIQRKLEDDSAVSLIYPRE